MRQLLFILILFPVLAFGQTFTLNDTAFKTGQILRNNSITWELASAKLRPESNPYLDSISDFLIKNKGLVIEIGAHCDSRVSDKVSSCLTCNRAKSIADYLILKGVQMDRIIPKGYQGKKPIITDEKIRKLKTKEEIEKAYQINRRIEFKIIRTDFISVSDSILNKIDLPKDLTVSIKDDNAYFNDFNENRCAIVRFSYLKSSVSYFVFHYNQSDSLNFYKGWENYLMKADCQYIPNKDRDMDFSTFIKGEYYFIMELCPCRAENNPNCGILAKSLNEWIRKH